MTKLSLKKLFNDKIDELNHEADGIKLRLQALYDKREKFKKECVLWRNDNDYKTNEKIQKEMVYRSTDKMLKNLEQFSNKAYQLLNAGDAEKNIVHAYNEYVGAEIARGESVLIRRANYEAETLHGFKSEEQRILLELSLKKKEIDQVADLMNCIFVFKKEEYAIWRGDE